MADLDGEARFFRRLLIVVLVVLLLLALWRLLHVLMLVLGAALGGPSDTPAQASGKDRGGL